MTVSVQTSSGGTHSDVDQAGLERLVEEMTTGGSEFLIVERSVGSSEIAQSTPAPDGGFAVEYRDDPNFLWTSVVPDAGQVLKVLRGWAFDEDGWKDGVNWSKLQIPI